MAAKDELYVALNQAVRFQVVQETPRKSQISIIGRVPKQGMDTWLFIIHHLILVTDSSPWSIDISKQYFNRGGKLMWGWRLIIQSGGGDFETEVRDVINQIGASPKARPILQEQPLPGGGRHSQGLQRGKGAQSVLNPIVGPMALLQQKMGG